MQKTKKQWKRTGTVLLVLALVTAGFIGVTFSKYVSKGEGSDNARVAKWGVEVAVTGDGFHETYGKGDATVTLPSGENISVRSTEKVVAPGTAGTFGGVTITGTPEVAVKVETTADVDLSGWNIAEGGEFYCPLVFTIGDTTINGLDYSKSTASGETSFERDIKKAIEDATTKELEAGTDLSTVGENITYSWKWPFAGATGTAMKQSDALDTRLGDNAANENAPTIDITVTTTVTQID